MLDELEPEPFVCLNGNDLSALGARIGQPLRVTSRRGAIVASARLDSGLPDGAVFMPFRYAEAAANLLTNPALDPDSKIPEYKFAAVRVTTIDQADRSPARPDGGATIQTSVTASNEQ